MRRVTGRRNAAAALDPGLSEPWPNFARGLTEDRFRTQPGQALEGWIHVQESVVERAARFVADHLMEREAVRHRIEERTVFDPTRARRLQIRPGRKWQVFC
jgi:hypothetical protein